MSIRNLRSKRAHSGSEITELSVPSYKRIRLHTSNADENNIQYNLLQKNIIFLKNSATKGNKTLLDALVKVADELVVEDCSQNDIGKAISHLIELFRQERNGDTMIRVMILGILTDLSKVNINEISITLIDEIVSVLKNENSNKVITKGLHSLLRIGLGKVKELPATHIKMISLFAQQQLTADSHRTQKNALLVLSSFIPLADAKKEIIEKIAQYGDSNDSGVRAESLRALLCLAERGAELSPDLYKRAIDAIRDDYECVRKEALQLVYQLGLNHSEHLISCQHHYHSYYKIVKESVDDYFHEDSYETEETGSDKDEDEENKVKKKNTEDSGDSKQIVDNASGGQTVSTPNDEGDNEEMRLIDAAFTKICGALSDISIQIRIQAAQYLGGMTKVSSQFLHQTLDKKLMSNLRRKRTAHERGAELVASGEWSSGKRWADDGPLETLNTTTISLIESGACGALIHGLEDEFMEVRIATVDSMCRLALCNREYAITCLDFLVDMFNDEIEEVRLKAIYSLTAIAKHIVLREDQLETMLSSLEDFSVEVREGLHIMLGACRVSTQACLLMVVQKLLDVLAKYPQDKLSAFGCMRKIGQKHSNLCMAITSHLLQDHPFFDSAERDVEDPAYLCILILLFNAAENLTPIISLFPDVTLKHYAYLRDAMPSLVPELPVEGASTMKHINDLKGFNNSLAYLGTLLNHINILLQLPNHRVPFLQTAQQNIKVIILK